MDTLKVEKQIHILTETIYNNVDNKIYSKV